MPLSNQKYKIQPTLINLHLNDCSQELHYYPFAIRFERCVASCIVLNDFSNKVFVPNKIDELNIHLFDIITGKNQSKY